MATGLDFLPLLPVQLYCSLGYAKPSEKSFATRVEEMAAKGLISRKISEALITTALYADSDFYEKIKGQVQCHEIPDHLAFEILILYAGIEKTYIPFFQNMEKLVLDHGLHPIRAFFISITYLTIDDRKKFPQYLENVRMMGGITAAHVSRIKEFLFYTEKQINAKPSEPYFESRMAAVRAENLEASRMGYYYSNRSNRPIPFIASLTKKMRAEAHAIDNLGPYQGKIKFETKFEFYHGETIPVRIHNMENCNPLLLEEKVALCCQTNVEELITSIRSSDDLPTFVPSVQFCRNGPEEGYDELEMPQVIDVFIPPKSSFHSVESTRSLIRTYCRKALENGNDSLLITASGSGIGRTNGGFIACQYRAVLGEPEFKNRFKKIVFAFPNSFIAGSFKLVLTAAARVSC
jgi:hypothetical protein